MFQHTAARRRLPANITLSEFVGILVSTHSRAEAAALAAIKQQEDLLMFQHTAARRRLQFNRKSN